MVIVFFLVLEENSWQFPVGVLQAEGFLKSSLLFQNSAILGYFEGFIRNALGFVHAKIHPVPPAVYAVRELILAHN